MGGRWTPLWFVLAFLILAGAARRAGDSQQEFDRHGRPALATPPAEITKTTKKKGGLVTIGTSYSGAFTFRTESGATVSAVRDFPEAMLPRIQAGTPVEIEYLPDRPQFIRFRGENVGGGRWQLLGIYFAVLAGWLVMRRIRSMRAADERVGAGAA